MIVSHRRISRLEDKVDKVEYSDNNKLRKKKM